MIPVVVLIGRPNVGKSTLFNRLTRTQNALVADFPGLTRDRQYGAANFEQHAFIIIDTGGIGVDDIAIDELMSKQSAMALNEADTILFLVDAKAGLTGIDETIGMLLRKIDKPIFLVVNKAENLEEDIASAEFQRLGFSNIYPISAAHGRGIVPLLSRVISTFNPLADKNLAEETKHNTIKIAFVGRPNVGKSTLINRILGEERVVVYDIPGTTRDSISIPFTRDNNNYTLIDTAGVRRRARIEEKIEKFSVIKTLQSIKASHVCLMLLDAKEGITEQDLHLLGFIIESGKALVIVVNKWDGLSTDHKERVQTELSRRLKFADFAIIRFISALYGSGVGLLFNDIMNSYTSAMSTLSTPKLTRLLHDIVSQHTPPMVNGRSVKLKFAHAGGHNPPRIVIHGNQVDTLPDSYKRYLMNAFVMQLNLVGTPLKLEFKSSSNPFKLKKNSLTNTQIKKRQRLIRHVKQRRS